MSSVLSVFHSVHRRISMCQISEPIQIVHLIASPTENLEFATVDHMSHSSAKASSSGPSESKHLSRYDRGYDVTS